MIYLRKCHHRNIITLIVPPTLFYNDLNVKEEILNGDVELSEILALKTKFSSSWGPGEHLIDYSKVERAGFGQGAIFTQGGDKAALHASPREYVFQTRITLVTDKCDI